jgi:hypothetical protein
MPNIHQNPFPNYQKVPPPNQLNHIEGEEFVFSIDDEVWTDFYKPTNGDSCHSTRTGKHFKPPHLEVEHLGREDLEREVPNVKSAEKVGKGKNISKSNEEEDKVLTQLKRTQATTSVWGLLMASPKHRDVILGALAEKEVSMTTSPKEVLSIMGVENVGAIISFTDKDLPPDGARHNRAFYIIVKCLKVKVPRVLVDNRSALNVFPLKTTTTLGIKRDQFSPSSLTIRAYDNSSRNVMGTFEVSCKTGPINATMVFHVLNIPTSYNLLVGRA